MNEIEAIMRSSVSIAIEMLTDTEVLALRMSVLFDMSPVHVPGYDKIEYLFTEEKNTKMHGEARRAFLYVSGLRLKMKMGRP